MGRVVGVGVLLVLSLNPGCGKDHDAARAYSAPADSERERLLGEMVKIPAGSFLMESQGASREMSLDAFEIDKLEITVRAYRLCVEAGACEARSTVDWVGLTEEKKRLYSLPCNWGKPDRDMHPMNCVDWHDATKFCACVGKRLPTEHEWELAARGRSAGTYPWGDAPPGRTLLNACGRESATWAKANWKKDWVPMFEEDDGWPTTSPVGSYPKGASPFGLMDVAGNVWEWTSSYYDADSPDRESYRVHRGGSWSNEQPGHVVVAFRNRLDPSFRNCNLGFRCAR